MTPEEQQAKEEVLRLVAGWKELFNGIDWVQVGIDRVRHKEAVDLVRDINGKAIMPLLYKSGLGPQQVAQQIIMQGIICLESAIEFEQNVAQN